MSEILSVREVKLPVILYVITADDRGSLRQPGCPGFKAFFKLRQLDLHSRPMKTNNCCSFGPRSNYIIKAMGTAAAWLKLKGEIKISFKCSQRAVKCFLSVYVSDLFSCRLD